MTAAPAEFHERRDFVGSPAATRLWRNDNELRQRVDGVALLQALRAACPWRLPMRSGDVQPLSPAPCKYRREATGPARRFVQQRFVGVWVLDLLEMLPGHGLLVPGGRQRAGSHRWRRGCHCMSSTAAHAVEHTLSSSAAAQSSRARVTGALDAARSATLLRRACIFSLAAGGRGRTQEETTRQRGGPTSEFTAPGLREKRVLRNSRADKTSERDRATGRQAIWRGTNARRDA